MFLPIEDKEPNKEASSSILIMSGNELLKEVKKEQDMEFVVLGKTRVILMNTYMDDLPEEIQELLEIFADIVVDELPHSLSPIRSISHHIDLIPGANFPKKSSYKLTHQENEELKNQVQEFLDKGLVGESLSPCKVPNVLSLKKDGECVQI
jgi:hypothetical protein